MAYKIIPFITIFTLFNPTSTMEKIELKEEKRGSVQYLDKIPSVETTLVDCEKIIKKLNTIADTFNQKVNQRDSNQENYNEKIITLENKIKITEENIKDLQNFDKNNDLHINTLEQSINLVTNKIEILQKHMHILNNNISQNYTTKEEAFFYQKNTQTALEDLKKKINLLPKEKLYPASPYKQYLLKIAPRAALITCIAILYSIRKPLQKKILATIKRIKSLFSRKKIILKRRIRV